MEKYYAVKGINLANAISFITGQKPYVFDDKYNKDLKIFSFVRDENFDKALDELNKLREKLYK